MLVVDEGGIGGQARSSSLIRNYLGFAKGVSGSRLAEQAYEQASVFGARFLFMHGRRPRALGRRLRLVLSDGRTSAPGPSILATGASYRRLEHPRARGLTAPASSTAARSRRLPR